MVYEKEVDESLRIALYREWMNEDEYNKIVRLTLIEMDTSKEELSRMFEEGVYNGVDIKTQMDMVKHAISLERIKDES